MEVATIFDRWPLDFRPRSLKPHEDTRKRLYGTATLTNDVRKKICADPAKFGDKLRGTLRKADSKLKPEYGSEEALVNFQMTKGQDLLKTMQSS